MFFSIPSPSAEGPDREVRVLGEVAGLKVIAITLRRGVSLPDHVAPGPISLQLLSGELTLLADGALLPLAVGQVTLLEAGVRHTLTPVGDAPALVLLHRVSA